MKGGWKTTRFREVINMIGSSMKSIRKLDGIPQMYPGAEEQRDVLFLGTAGLSSASQLVDFTGALVAVNNPTTGKIEEAIIEWPLVLPEEWPHQSEKVIRTREDVGKSPAAADIAQGYRAMALENQQFAEDVMPLMVEIWPDWKG